MPDGVLPYLWSRPFLICRLLIISSSCVDICVLLLYVLLEALHLCISETPC